MGRTALLACPEGGTSLSAMAGLDRSSFNTEPGLRSISFSLFVFLRCLLLCRQLFCCSNVKRSTSSPSPSAHCVRIHLSQRERPWHDGKVSVQSAKCVVSPEALPLRKDSPRSGGRCRAATKGGIWHRVAMTERASPPTKIHSRDVLLHAKRTVARYFVQRFFFRWISLSSRCRQGWRPARWKRRCTASLRSALPAPAWAG